MTAGGQRSDNSTEIVPPLRAGILQRPRPTRDGAVIACLIGLCVALSWQVVATSLTAYFAEADPEMALILNSNNATARLALAERSVRDIYQDRLANAGTRVQAFSKAAQLAVQASPERSDPAKLEPAQPIALTAEQRAKLEAARAILERELLAQPLNARALRIMGQIVNELQGREAAAPFMQMAAQRSLRDQVATFWMLEWSVDQKDLTAALSYADTLLRTHSNMPAHVVPILGRIAEIEGGSSSLKTLLATDPPWRPQFFSVLPTSVRNLRTPLDLLVSLKGTARPPSTQELRSYLEPLIAGKQYELAYYTWLQFLPENLLANVGLLFNGSFEIALTNLPFDWQLPVGSGVATDIVRRPDRTEESALRISFGEGRGQFAGVSQLVMLAAGSYRLEGSYTGDLVGRRGLVWRISCAEGNGQPIGASQMFIGPSPTWSRFEFPFTVPVSGCRAQRLLLTLDARSESEKLISGSAWFDDLSITRNGEADRKPL